MKISAIPPEFLAPPDAGAGSGGYGSSSPDSGGSGAGSGQSGSYDSGSGQGGGRQSGRGQQQQSTTPYKLSDDSLVDLGDNKPVKWSEARQRYVPREEHEKLRGTFEGSRKLLEDHAAQLDRGFAALEAEKRRLSQMSRQGQQQQQQPDLADELENMPLLDGRTAARVVKQLREQGLAPLAQMFARQQATITDLSKRVEGLQGTAGTLGEAHQQQQFEEHITNALKNVGEVKGFPGVVPTDDPIIRSLASDLWLSYDAKTWKMPDFYKMLNERIAGFTAVVRRLDQKAIADAKEKKRTFFNPNRGAGQGGGERKFEFRRGLDIARESGLFQGANA